MATKNRRQKLVTKLDGVFSIYIRLRDRVSDDYAKCITCGKVEVWKGSNKVDNGHFQSRKHMATRWHEQNCHAQCVACNNWGSGEQYKFGIALDKKFGKGTADKMVLLSNTTAKWAIFELEAMIDHYENKIRKELEKRKTSVTLPKKYTK